MSESPIVRHIDDNPAEDDLCDAYELELQSSAGEPVRFGELVTGKGGHITTIIIFIRHFFCAYDRDYVHSISQHLTESILESLPQPAGPSQVIIIGCGDSSNIVPYVTETSAKFPLYTDPSGKIYESLQMKRNTCGITTPPAYTHMSFFRALGLGLKHMFQNPLNPFSGGPWGQNGGEWIFRGGKCVYAHRMEHVSDHLTVEQLLEHLREDKKGSGEMGDA